VTWPDFPIRPADSSLAMIAVSEIVEENLFYDLMGVLKQISVLK
jgi:hypothetical protein